MKAIKINTNVNLFSGITLPSGAIVVIAEGYTDVKNQKDGFIPSQIATLLFASLEALQSGKVSINDVADYTPVFSGLQLSVVDYSTKSAEQLLVDTVEAELIAVYGAENIEEVEI
jgi:hypothetical protein